MAGTLLIIGITLFLVGTLALAQDASSRNRNWLVVVMPFTGVGYARYHWSDVRIAVLLRVMGGALMLFAAGAYMASHAHLLDEVPSPRAPALSGSLDSVDAVISVDPQTLINIADDENSDLSGRIAGEPFHYFQVQLVRGVLSFQQGKDFIAAREVRILLGLDSASLSKREEILVRPKDRTAPEVQISVRQTGSSLPQTRIYRSGYSMELQLAPLDRNQLKGYVRLILPGKPVQYLVGEFVANTNNLRYKHGRVDLTYDNPDTLEYVAAQYVEAQYPKSTIKKIEYHNTQMHLSRNSGSTTALVYLKNGRIEEKRLQLERAEIGWALRPGGVDTSVVQEGSDSTRPQSSVAASAENQQQPPLQLSFDELASIAGQRVVIQQADGEQSSGKVIGVRHKLLQLESQVGSGVVSYSLPVKDIVSMTLQDGRKVILSDGQASATAATPTAPATDAASSEASENGTADEQTAPAESTPPAPAPVTTVDGYAALKGETVRVVSKDGKTREGTLVDAGDKGLRLSVRVGAGVAEYFYAPGDIESVTRTGR